MRERASLPLIRHTIVPIFNNNHTFRLVDAQKNVNIHNTKFISLLNK